MTPEVEEALEHLYYHRLGGGPDCSECTLALIAVTRRIEELGSCTSVS